MLNLPVPVNTVMLTGSYGDRSTQATTRVLLAEFSSGHDQGGPYDSHCNSFQSKAKIKSMNHMEWLKAGVSNESESLRNEGFCCYLGYAKKKKYNNGSCPANAGITTENRKRQNRKEEQSQEPPEHFAEATGGKRRKTTTKALSDCGGCWCRSEFRRGLHDENTNHPHNEP